MAIDNTIRRQDLLKNLVLHSTRFMAEYRALIDILEFNAANGFTYQASDFDLDGLRHMENVNEIGGAIVALQAFMEANSNQRFNQFSRAITS